MARRGLGNICRLLSEVNEELPVEQCFLSDLKRSIEMSAEKENRPPSQTYKPSSMNCIRNMFYQVVGQPQDEGRANYALVGICNSGSDIHERIQKAVTDMKENGIDCEYVNVADYVRERNLTNIEVVAQQGMETKLFHKELNMSFLCDGIIRYKGKYYVLELKTESVYKWQSRKDVDPKHHMQGTAYSVAFGINEVIFVYISRDVLDMKAFMFVPSEEMKLTMLGRIAECNDYIAKGELPPIPDDLPKTACTYCSYKQSCGKNKT